MRTRSRQEIQRKLLVPVGECRRELVRPMDATAVGHHDHLFASVAKAGHHWMDVLAKPLCINMGDSLIEDFGGPLLDRADDTEQHATDRAAPTPIAHPRLACAGLFAFDLALAQRACEQPSALG